MHPIKVIIYNILLCFALLGALFLAPPVLYLVWNMDGEIDQDSRASLSLYKDYDWAVRHFYELAELPSVYYDYFTWRRGDYNGETITIENGIRITPTNPSATKEKSEFWFFGGSTTWGTGVDDRNTYPALFAEKHQVRVKNFGESGYVSQQSMAYLQLIEGRTIHDNVVIVFYDGINDIYFHCQRGSMDLASSRQEVIREYVRRSSDRMKFRFERTFSQLFDMTQRIVGQRTIAAEDLFGCHDNPEHAKFVARTLVETWRHAQLLSEARGLKFYAILQPAAFSNTNYISYLDVTTPSFAATTKQHLAVYPLIRKYAKDAGISFVDLSSSYDGCINCYIDFSHVTPHAHHLLVKDLEFLAQSTKANTSLDSLSE